MGGWPRDRGDGEQHLHSLGLPPGRDHHDRPVAARAPRPRVCEARGRQRATRPGDDGRRVHSPRERRAGGAHAHLFGGPGAGPDAAPPAGHAVADAGCALLGGEARPGHHPEGGRAGKAVGLGGLPVRGQPALGVHGQSGRKPRWQETAGARLQQRGTQDLRRPALAHGACLQPGRCRGAGLRRQLAVPTPRPVVQAGPRQFLRFGAPAAPRRPRGVPALGGGAGHAALLAPAPAGRVAGVHGSGNLPHLQRLARLARHRDAPLGTALPLWARAPRGSGTPAAGGGGAGSSWGRSSGGGCAPKRSCGLRVAGPGAGGAPGRLPQRLLGRAPRQAPGSLARGGPQGSDPAAHRYHVPRHNCARSVH
mmetsp:Transcript_114099/g.363774  ORF Transcript_114099/g.363774 Transcript_114099/m.363774 type:complete len:365 (+) Transcript_114099:751-1845(+)